MRGASYCWLIFCFYAFTMTGCASSPDPREGGFFGGIHGISSGTYDQRVKEREERLERMRALQEEMNAEGRELEQTRTDLELAIQGERQEMAMLDKEIDDLEAELIHLATVDSQKNNQIQEARQRLNFLKAGMHRQKNELDDLEGTHGHDEAILRLMQLTEQRDSLRREFDLLLDLSLELAR